MLKIDSDNNITLTRGDTLTLTLELTKDGEAYTPLEDDAIRFALAKGYAGAPGYELIAEATVENMTIVLPAEQTTLDYGTYNYDVQITHGDGSVDTFISASLKIIGEVA